MYASGVGCGRDKSEPSCQTRPVRTEQQTDKTTIFTK